MNPRSLGVAISISLLLTIVPITGVLAGTPEIPHSPTPSNDSSAVSVFANPKWTAGDPGSNESYTYTVYFGTSNPPPRAVENQTGTSYEPGTLATSIRIIGGLLLGTSLMSVQQVQSGSLQPWRTRRRSPLGWSRRR